MRSKDMWPLNMTGNYLTSLGYYPTSYSENKHWLTLLVLLFLCGKNKLFLKIGFYLNAF